MTEAERIAEWTTRAQIGGEGAAEAFESLYTFYRKRVYFFCHCMLGDEPAAIDTTCSVFLYAWRNLRSMPAEQTFYHWVCSNAFYFAKIALAGLRGTSVTVEEVEGDPALFDEMVQTPEKISAELTVRRSHLDTVTRQVLALSDEERICVMLYDYARFPLEEAATMVGCSVDTFKCRVYNGHAAICEGLDARTPGDGGMFRPFLDKLIRTCGKNCTMPDEVTERIRTAIAEGKDVEFPVSEEPPAEEKTKDTSLAINRICIILAFLFAGALTYILYWFMSSPNEPENTSDGSSFQTESSVSTGDTTSDVLSGVSEGEESEESSSPDESSVPGDESEPDTSSGEPSSGAETSGGTSEESSPEESVPPVLGDLPRVTENLRLRTEPSTEDPNNLVIMIPKGSHIDILEGPFTNDAGEVWYRARYTASSGIYFDGYCSADYVQTEE